MTIEQLLAMAQEYCGYIQQAENRDRVDHERITRYAACAQAAAQTAQAMILYAACSKGSGMGDAPSYSLRVLADVVMG